MKRISIKYAARKGRVKTTLWLDRDVLSAVGIEADRRKVSKQSIMENTLKERYCETGRLDKDAAIADRLNKVDRRLRKIEEHDIISAEAHALFVRMWLASTPEVHPADKESAVKSARERYERYVGQIVKRVGKGFPETSELVVQSSDFASDL